MSISNYWLGDAVGDDLVDSLKLIRYKESIANYVNIIAGPGRFKMVWWEGSRQKDDSDILYLTGDIKSKNFDSVVGNTLREVGVKLWFGDSIHSCSSMLVSYLKDASDRYQVNILYDEAMTLYRWLINQWVHFKVCTGMPGYHGYFEAYHQSQLPKKQITQISKDRTVADYLNGIAVGYHLGVSKQLHNLLPDIEGIVDEIRSAVAKFRSDWDHAQRIDELETLTISLLISIAKVASDSKQPNRLFNPPTYMNKVSNMLFNAEKKQLGRSTLSTIKFASTFDVDIAFDGSHPQILLDLTKSRLSTGICKDPNTPVGLFSILGQLEGRAISHNVSDMGRHQPAIDKAIQTGLRQGAVLGHKLELGSSHIPTAYHHQRSGKLDRSRIAYAGLGVDDLFIRTFEDLKVNTVLHITLDCSSSMWGPKWLSCIMLATSLAKAALYLDSVRVIITLRGTLSLSLREKSIVDPSRDAKLAALTAVIYDSKVNSIEHLVDAFTVVYPGSYTPEGLCYNHMMKQGLIIPSDRYTKSYMINVSDGLPNMRNLSSSFYGREAIKYTKGVVNAIKNQYGVEWLSFYTHSHSKRWDTPIESWSSRGEDILPAFAEMYGSDARQVDPHDVSKLASVISSKLLAGA